MVQDRRALDFTAFSLMQVTSRSLLPTFPRWCRRRSARFSPACCRSPGRRRGGIALCVPFPGEPL